MKTQVRKPSTLFITCLFVCAGLIMVCFLWVKHEQRQIALNRELIEALRYHDTKQTFVLLDEGADPNTRIESPPRPTFQELLSQLFHHKSPPTNNSPTALIAACNLRAFHKNTKEAHSQWVWDRQHDQQMTQVVKRMLEHNANVNARDERGSTALMDATYLGYHDRMTLLLQYHVAVDAQNRWGETALHQAVLGEDPESVRLLIKYHANPNLKDKKGITPLAQAHPNTTPGYRFQSKIISILNAAGAKE